MAIESVYNQVMDTQKKRILPSEAAAALGSIRTPKKAASSAANGIKTRWQAKPLEALTCTCGKCPDSPKTYCPRGRAIIRRRAKAEAQANAQGSGSMTNTIEYSKVETNGTTNGDAARNPLAAALALVAASETTTQERTTAKTDAASDLEALREERFSDAR